MINPYIIIAAIGALLVSFTCGGLLGWHEKTIRVPAELTAQQNVDAKECQQAQQITKDTNDELQKDISSISAQLRTYKLRKPATCVRIARPSDDTGSGGEHAANDGTGVNSDWLRDFAATAEQYREEVSLCSDFLTQERKLFPAH